jgi:hypothetical protein
MLKEFNDFETLPVNEKQFRQLKIRSRWVDNLARGKDEVNNWASFGSVPGVNQYDKDSGKTFS